MLRVRSWCKYQSYKDRRPPWIRFHRTILDDYQFQSMSADARALLPMLWLLACEDENPTSGLIPYSFEEISFRLRQDKKKIIRIVSELEGADFIECIDSVTKPLQKGNQSVPPETETETETDYVHFDDFWKHYPKKKGKQTAKKAWNKLKVDKELFSVILPSLENQKKSIDWIKDNGQYIPHASTWLNGARWEDETEQMEEDEWTQKKP